MSLSFNIEYMNILFMVTNALVICCLFVAVSKATEFSFGVIQRIGFSLLALGLSVNLLSRIELVIESDSLTWMLLEIPGFVSFCVVQAGLGILALNHLITLFLKILKGDKKNGS